MVRLARFSADAFVQAAMILVAEAGPGAATMAAIARRVGAPTGSIYHRFDSRAAVIGAAWLAAHVSLVERIEKMLRAGRGLDAALGLAAWAREDVMRARFLLLNDEDMLFEDAPPAATRRVMRAQQDRLDDAFSAYLAAAVGADRAQSPELAARGKFAVFDGPIALLRPPLLAGGPIPQFIDDAIGDLYRAMAPNAGIRAPAEQAA